MNRMILKIIFILSLSFNAAFLIHLFTRPAETQTAPSPSGHLYLELTDQQKKQIAPVQQAMQRQNETIKKQVAQYQGQLLEALKKEPVDRTEVSRCINQINGLQKQIQLNTVEEIIRIREYMNPEQCNCLIGCLGASMEGSSHTCDSSCCSPGGSGAK
ncbi:MAG: periplasmic heavy metal sensor [bacterium]|nr:periplasmic heavy metal sensor [bacterium]